MRERANKIPPLRSFRSRTRKPIAIANGFYLLRAVTDKQHIIKAAKHIASPPVVID